MMLMLVSLFLGGSASRPDFELSVILIALTCLLIEIWIKRSFHYDWRVISVLIIFLFVPFLQLIPLPGALKINLPQVQLSYIFPQHVSIGIFSRSSTINADQTIYSILAAVPALAQFWIVSSLAAKDHLKLAAALVVSVGAMAGLGIFQAVGATNLKLFEYTHPNVAIGFFASRNHFADLLILTCPLIFLLEKPLELRIGRFAVKCFTYTMCSLYIGAVVGSGSRSGSIIFLIVFLTSSMISSKSFRGVRACWWLIPSSLVFYLTFPLLSHLGFIGVLIRRFSEIDEFRPQVWSTSLEAGISYFPFGSGIGNFDLSYEQFEKIDSIGPNYINSAHNELIQLFVESGLVGLIAALSIFVIVIERSVYGWRSPFVKISSVALFGIFAHSLDDYPFRVLSINVQIGFLLGVLFGNVAKTRGCRRVDF